VKLRTMSESTGRYVRRRWESRAEYATQLGYPVLLWLAQLVGMKPEERSLYDFG
jgi:hypothetical protein